MSAGVDITDTLINDGSAWNNKGTGADVITKGLCSSQSALSLWAVGRSGGWRGVSGWRVVTSVHDPWVISTLNPSLGLTSCLYACSLMSPAVGLFNTLRRGSMRRGAWVIYGAIDWGKKFNFWGLVCLQSKQAWWGFIDWIDVNILMPLTH